MNLEQEVKELQRQLAVVDLINRPSRQSAGYEFLVLKLGALKIKMYQEKKHSKPHVHIDYGKRNHVASYSIDPVKRLAGTLSSKYDEVVKKWIEERREALLNLWSATQQGTDNSELLVALAGDV